MAKSKIDAKEFMLQYGDRIGVGIAGLLAFLFILFAILGSGSGVSAEQVKESSKKADQAILQSEVNPEKIALKDDPQVKPLNQIDELSKSLTKLIENDQLQLPYRFFERDILRGTFRSNPNVLQPLEVAAIPLVGAFRIYEVRINNKAEEVMVLTPRAGVTPPKLPGGNGMQSGTSRGLSGSSSGERGGGAAGGLGSLGAGMLGSSGGSSAGRGGAGGGAGSGAGRTPPPKATTTNPGGDESIYTFVWSKDFKPTDTIGVTIRPLRSAYLAATYPHGKQTEEIAKKLQIQKHEVERLYRRIEVERRRVILKGSPLPNGKLAEVEYIEIINPRDRTKSDFKTLAEIEKTLQSADDQMSAEDRDAMAGWSRVNIENVAAIMKTAYSTAKFNNEGFFEEKEPIIQNLIDYAGPRVAMRLPKLVRNEYPDITSKLPTLMGALKKIKEDEKAKIPPPPKDARISGGTADEEFDRLAGGTGSDQKSGDSGKDAGKDAPELSGPIPEYIPIRFVDVDLPTDLVGATTFEYRLRVVLNNPNYKREQDVAAPEFAKDEMLFGDWSPIARVTFEPDYLIYAGERDRAKGSTDDREKDKVPVQLHKWLGKVEVIGGSDRDYAIVGDWWIEKLLVSRGEYIGRSPDLPGAAGESNLIQWVSHAFDTIQQRIGADVQKKTRTIDLMTSSILVDFQGGAYQSFRSEFARTSRKEDVPAEVLIVEPDGRMIARHVSDYRNDEGRKQRFDHWKTWVDNLGKPSDGKPAAPPPSSSGSGKNRGLGSGN